MSDDRMYLSTATGRCALCAGEGCANCTEGVPMPMTFVKAKPFNEAETPYLRSRDCECPAPNADCEHPTCPRYPQPGHLRAEFLGDLAAFVGQNSLPGLAMDLDRLLVAYAAAELRAAAAEIDQDGDAASVMEYDELAGGQYRASDRLRTRAEQMEPHQ